MPPPRRPVGPTPAGPVTLPRIVVPPVVAGEAGPRRRSPLPGGAGRTGLVDYYTATRADYALWSRRFNMHFGFWRPGMSVIDREAMLEQMNVEVSDRLHLAGTRRARVLDMGCGVGATAQTVTRRAPGATVVGITLVPWQAAQARAQAAGAWAAAGPPVILADYTASPFPDAAFDAVYSVESSCYATGLAKEDLLSEMARLVRPGGRFVVADAFLRMRDIPNPVTRAAHRALCASWALDTLGELGAFSAAATRVGFDDLLVEDISLNVAPSSLHIPAVTFHFLASVFLGRSTDVSTARWLNAMTGGPLFLLAADPSAIGYFLVSGTRR